MEFPLSSDQAAVSPIPCSDSGGNELARLPLTFAQQRAWEQARACPGGSRNLTAVLRLAGVSDTAALERALHQLVLCHPALWAAFLLQEGAPLQVAGLPPRPPTLKCEGLDGLA